MYMCLVLFVVSKILDSSEILSRLLEMGVEYYLVCIREGLLCGKGVEPPRGRLRLSGVRETQLFFGVYFLCPISLGSYGRVIVCALIRFRSSYS